MYSQKLLEFKLRMGAEFALRDEVDCNRQVSCRECADKETCIVPKMVPILHFIKCVDWGMYSPGIKGSGVNFVEIHAQIRGESRKIKDILTWLLQHEEIRELPNGKYTTVMEIDVARDFQTALELARKYWKRHGERSQKLNENILRSYNDIYVLNAQERERCQASCAACVANLTCSVPKLLPIFHFISLRDHALAMAVEKFTGKALTSSDDQLGSSIEEIQVELGSDYGKLQSLLDQLLEFEVIKKLPNGKYTQFGLN